MTHRRNTDGHTGSEAPLDVMVAEVATRASELVGDERSVSSLLGGQDLFQLHADIAECLERLLELIRPDSDTETASTWSRIVDLHRLACRITAEAATRRLQAWERVHAALHRLGELGPASEIVDRAAGEAAAAGELERVVLSRVDDGRLVAEAVHIQNDAVRAATTLAALREQPVRLGYPLVEGEMLRRRRPLLVNEPGGHRHGRSAHASVMGWQDYVAVPVVLDRRVIGFLHGDRLSSDRPLTGVDRDSLSLFADGFAQIFERAVLRHRLRTQHQEMRNVAHWADARTSDLSDRAISLATDRESREAREADVRAHATRSDIQDLLTPREIDVLGHMVNGDTNAGIAQALVVSEGTVKFHVKNILRKMQAANRAEATSKYLRMKLSRNILGDANADPSRSAWQDIP